MTYDCMTPAELAAWLEAAEMVRRRSGEGTRKPCTDCPLSFRLEELAMGRCRLQTTRRRELLRARREKAYNRSAGTSSIATIPDAVPLLVPGGAASPSIRQGLDA